MSQSNPRLKDLFRQDQQYRYSGGLLKFQSDPELRPKVRAGDIERRQAVLDMIQYNELKTAGDYWRASVLLQHGTTADDYKLAYQSAVKGVELGQPSMNSLIARATDRYLV